MSVSFRSSLLLVRALNCRRRPHLEQPTRWKGKRVWYSSFSCCPSGRCGIMVGSYQQQHRHNSGRGRGNGQPCNELHAFFVPNTVQAFPCFSTNHQSKEDYTSPSHASDEINRSSSSSLTRESLLLSILEDTASHPPGCLTRSQIKDAEQLLESLASQSHSTAFSTALFVLNRLVQEQESYESHPRRHVHLEMDDDGEGTMDGNNDDHNNYRIRPYILNKVLYCWKRGYSDGLVGVKPAEVIALVDDLESRGIVTPDSRSLSLLVDGICLGTGAQGRRRQRRDRRYTTQEGGDNDSRDTERFEAPLLAQWLFDRRMEQAQEDETLRPDTVLLTNIIRAWAKSGRMEAPEMADGILELMHDLYNRGWRDSGPNTLSYGVTMEAWSNSRHPDACHRIDALLQEMKDSHLEHVLPDRVSYQYALNGWANSCTRSGANRAYSILQEMVLLYKGGNDLVAPNVSNFSKVMAALARHGDVGRVELMLEELQGLYSASGGDRNFQPNDDCWIAYIIAQAKAGAVEEAQGMLDEMVERALSTGSRERMPRRGHFVDVLVAWSKHKDPVVAAEKSQKVLDRMSHLGSNGYRDLLPDSKLYDRVISAWSRSKQQDAPEKIEHLLEQRQHMTTSIDEYPNPMLSWLRSGRGGSCSNHKNMTNTSGGNNNATNTKRNQLLQRPKRDPDCTLVIKNLAKNVKEADVINMFQPFAIQTKAKILGSNLNHHRGLAFVDFDSVAPVMAALQQHAESPFEWNGKALEVDQKTAEQRSRNNGFRNGGGGG